MILEKIYLNKTQIVLQDVDGSEVALTLDDAREVYQFVKDHLQEIEEKREANWQAYLNTVE